MHLIRAILDYFERNTAREEKTEHGQEETSEKVYEDAYTMYDSAYYDDYEFESLKDKYRF